MEWLKRRLESLLDNLIFAVIGAGGAAVWIAMKSLPLPIVVGTFVLIFVIILVVIRFVILRLLKNDKLQSTFQIYDAEMVKHLIQIKKMLDTFKKQLMVISNKKGILGNLEIAIEKQRGFYQIWEHCPSIKKAGLDLRLSRLLHEAKLKNNLVNAEDDTHIKGRMKALADAIDNCLSDGEYLEHSCSNCIEKRNQLTAQSREDYQSLGDGIQVKSYDKRDVIISREQRDFAIQWVKESNYFERFIGETDTPILGVNCYIVFKPMRGRITVESLWLDIAAKIARTSGEWTTETFVKETTHNLQFDIPPNIPRGERTAKLMAIVDGSEVVCDEVTLHLPSEK